MSKELAGRVFVVTGANAGIGRVTTEVLARRGARVILACRSEARAQPVVDAICAETGNDQIRFVQLDLASLASVQACAQKLLNEEPKIHVLINNAGVAGLRGDTKEGFELAFGVNHVGHFLLTKLLLPRIKASGKGRIVNVSSKAHYKASGFDWSLTSGSTKTYTALDEYQLSKLANILFTKELARRLEGSDVTTYALHPGVVASSIWKRVPWGVRHLVKLFMISNEEGALTTLHCALSEEAGKESGLYYDLCKPKEPSQTAQDAALAKELWEKSEKWVLRFSNVEDDTPQAEAEPEAKATEEAEEEVAAEEENAAEEAAEATEEQAEAAEAEATEEQAEVSDKAEEGEGKADEGDDKAEEGEEKAAEDKPSEDEDKAEGTETEKKDS